MRIMEFAATQVCELIGRHRKATGRMFVVSTNTSQILHEDLIAIELLVGSGIVFGVRLLFIAREKS